MRTESKAGDWPWHAAILLKVPNTNLANYQCGGNIISSTAILTGKKYIIFLNSPNIFDVSHKLVHLGIKTDYYAMKLSGIMFPEVIILSLLLYTLPVLIWNPF